ncbi:hypothetical protein FA15DRAFT_705420 [Coprinopsis marcescibilis]|uniref:DUF6533 domain-containing protein n=1 Tax=Coprinopsis marcescibilis TaxID=230819 RepID=A0A5C3KSH1_COPMA|nr:hypothetical protein FA15DRAFT_705420 [Coprinopsis marcescibilis]
MDKAMIAMLEQAAYHRRITNQRPRLAFTYVSNYADPVASFALAGVDYLHTLPEEIRLVWFRKWSLVKVLFLVVRYFPWAYGSLYVYVCLTPYMEFKHCGTVTNVSTFIMISGVIVAEAIMFIRVFALCGGGKKLLIWLVLQFLAVHGAIYALMYKFMTGIEYMPSFLPTIFACMHKRAPDTTHLYTLSAILVASEAVIMIISLVGFWNYRRTPNQLLSAFRRDGVAYFVMISAISSTNIAVFSTLPPQEELRFVVGTPQVMLHCILSCRMILHLYETADKETQITDAARTLSDIHFAGTEEVGESSKVERGNRSSLASRHSNIDRYA